MSISCSTGILPVPCCNGHGQDARATFGDYHGAPIQALMQPIPSHGIRRAYVPLWMAIVLASVAVVTLIVWTIFSISPETSDGRVTIFFWGGQQLGDGIYAIVNRFAHLPENLDGQGQPKYKVIVGTATAPDIAQ